MPPHTAQLLRYILPVLIILPMLVLRLRGAMKPQALKLNRLWMRPALYAVIAGAVLFVPLPTPRGAVATPPLTMMDMPWLALALVLGAAAGWQWGRLTKLHRHAETGALMSRGGVAGALVLMAVIGLKLGLRAGAADIHVNTRLISDASVLFSVALFAVRSLEIYLRAKRAQDAPAPIKGSGPWNR